MIKNVPLTASLVLIAWGVLCIFQIFRSERMHQSSKTIHSNNLDVVLTIEANQVNDIMVRGDVNDVDKFIQIKSASNSYDIDELLEGNGKSEIQGAMQVSIGKYSNGYTIIHFLMSKNSTYGDVISKDHSSRTLTVNKFVLKKIQFSLPIPYDVIKKCFDSSDVTDSPAFHR